MNCLNQSGFQPADSREYELLSIVHNIYTLRNSGYVGNKMPRRFQNSSVCLGNMLAKKNCQ